MPAARKNASKSTTRKPRTLRAPKLNPLRVQDWIVDAINPLLDGLASQERVLRGGFIEWSPLARAFTNLDTWRNYLPLDADDNLADWHQHSPGTRPLLDACDAALGVLEAAIAKRYAKLSEDPKFTAAVRTTSEAMDEPTVSVVFASAAADRAARDLRSTEDRALAALRGYRDEAVRRAFADDGVATERAGLLEALVKARAELAAERSRLVDRYALRPRPSRRA